MIQEKHLSKRRSKLSAAKRALLEKRLRGEFEEVSKAHVIRPRQEPDLFPLSFAQERLWLVDQLEPGNPAYNRPMALRLTGPLNVKALQQALSEILERHEVLRATFPSLEGRPNQIITPVQSQNLPVIDLSEQYLNEREARAMQLATEESQKSFDLTTGPLLRATLLRLDKEEHVLLLVIHHIAFDGWSVRVFTEEIVELYEAFSKGRPSPLPELPLQYADFAHWQRQWLKGEVLETQLSYWKKKLAGSPPALNLPTDRPRPTIQTFCGFQQSLIVSSYLYKSLKTLSRQEDATLFMTLFAAFLVLLHRYTGQDDIVVGTPIGGRSRIETEGLIGFFVNTLAVRTDLSGNLTFQELLANVREITLESYENQDLPFEKLVEELQPERDMSRTPLFQVMFNFENIPRLTQQIQGLRIHEMELVSRVAPFDLTLEIIEKEEGLSCVFNYNTDLFDSSTIERMAGHFQTLLEGIVANPEQRISELPLLTAAERHQLLVEWNNTKRDYPRDKCIHQLFEEQVDRTPDAVALLTETEKLTYSQLNNRANQVARRIISLGVGPDRIVGVFLERSAEMIAVILGILKAGGAYMPLDPEYPKDRLAFMLSDSQAQILVTQSQLKSQLPEKCPEILDLNTDWKDAVSESSDNPQCNVQPNNLAYLLYTSGSTGVPKGVAIEHHSPVALISWAHEVFTKKEMSGVLFSTSICFDLSVFEIFSPLTTGGKVILADNLLELPSLKTASEVTLINTVPSAIAELVRIEGIPPSVCTVNLAGELLKSSLVQKIHDVKSIQRVYDLYGPSEDTTYSTWVLRISDGPQIIGRPISNTQAYILDQQRQLVPVGVIGELYLGGDGLARGYLHRPDLTAEKFIKNPFDCNSPRLYATGDLVRYLPDGNLVYMGRIDHQVKIRGFRIELGEIEAVLSNHPAVKDQVVVAHELKPGDKRIIAYIVPKNKDISTAELRTHLAAKVPNYMIPSNFVELEVLPLTPNGKVDRKALPVQNDLRPELIADYVEPRNGTEKAIADIWKEVLNLREVGVHDDFFELGGHSLLATQVISRVIKTFRVQMPLRSLFQAPTVAELAAVIVQKQVERPMKKGTVLAKEPEIPRRGVLESCPVSFAQQRLWFLDQFEPGSPVYNVPAAVRLSGLLNVKALEQSLNEIVQRHEALRTAFSAVQGEPMQVITPTLRLTLAVTDLQQLPEAKREAEAQRLAGQEARRPFDLSQSPLLRATLLRLDKKDHVLLLTMHHIVSDGWSMGVLFREVSVLYEAFTTGGPSPLSELPIQYADFAVWQRQWLQGEVLEKQLDYWRKQLEAAPPLLELPTDRPRPTIQAYRGARQALILPPSLTEALKALSLREGVTLFMMLLAGFKTLLYRCTGQGDIIVGSPIANRNRVEIEGLIGFFVNTLVLRTDLSENPTFRQLLRRVREVCLEAYAHQDLPFEKLVEELQPERNLGYSPLFQVMFILQNAPGSALEFPDLTLNPLEVDNGTAKFDLTFSLVVGPDGLRGTLEYNTALFDSSTIERMAGHFQTLLEGIVANPEQRISELPLLTAAERHQLLVEWNNTKRDYPRDKCIHQLFEEQVDRTPDAMALVFEDQQMTYRELNDRANQLAHHLRSLGVAPEVLVGICMERSLEMVVGLLGILKAGGAYVPLDPSYPKERLAFMLEDTQTPVLLSQRRLASRLPEHNAHLLCLDKGVKGITQYSKENHDCGVKPENLAYVIYTSGSTGKPKGVSMPHDPLINLLEWQFQYINNLSDAKTLQFTTLSFDPSFQEIFSTLGSGGTLVLIPEDLRRDMRSLYHLLGDASIERLFLPFIALQLLAEAAIDQGPMSLSLKEVITAGEQLQITPQIARLFRGLPDCRLYNLYGPTESHVVTAYSLMDSPDDWPLLPSIGRPISNSKIYLLDANLHPLPIGVPGELYIGGACLARGYFNQPSLTAEKFIPNPFSNNLGERLYKTGDLASYMPDGNIMFIGRIDHQVKIRGFRIEPAEIEGILGQHPAVREAIVSAVENQPGIKRLVAYVVTEKDKSPNISELRRILKIKLPDHMVPSAFVFIDALPQTPSGKVDRKSLPLPSQERPELVNEFIMPRTPIEKTIAGIWSNILKIDRVGINDNFFELGGHSLLATQVISRLINTFRVKVTLRSLFQAPTVAELAVVIVQKQVEKAESKDIDRTFAELEALSDEEARRLFNHEGVNGGNGN